MRDERSADLDLGAAHLRPQRREAPRSAGESPGTAPDRLPWERSRRGGLAGAFIGTWWPIVRAAGAAFAAVPGAGGLLRPWTFALLCGAVFGVISEIVDATTVALIYSSEPVTPAEIFQFEIAGRSFEWLPISALSAAGCLFALLVGAPLFVLVYSLLLVAWTTILHLLLRIVGGLSSSETGYQGTARAVCYSQAAVAGAVVPWIGDPVAVLWCLGLQVPALSRMHGCTRGRAAVAVGAPLAALLLALLLIALLAEPEVVVAATPRG